MTIDKWYEFFIKSNGEPIAYIQEKAKADLYKKSFHYNSEYKTITQKEINLEYRLTKQDVPEGYFKYKSHAEKFNQEILKGKGIISPNN